MKKIYRYNPRMRPIPRCVLDGGHLYDGTYCLGFGVESSEFEISIEEAYDLYEEITLKAENQEEVLSADDFFDLHGVSKRQLVIEELKDSDNDMSRIVEDIFNCLKTKGFIRDEDLNPKALEKLLNRKNLREKLK